jgi:ABC-2 type transport system permease protein
LGNGLFVARAASFDVDSLVSSVFVKIQAILVPLLGILGAYSAYGRERTSGVLESVLVRPITRRGLFISRYVATVLPLCLGAAATVLVTDAVTRWISGAFLSPGFVVGMVASMAVEVSAFAAITFLLSHLLRSSGGLIITAIVLYLVLDLLWGNVVLSFFQPGIGPYMSVMDVQIQIFSNMLNPSQYIALEEIFRQGSVSMDLGQAFGGLEIPVASYGLTIWSLAFDGIAWIAIPLLAAIRLAQRRD